MGRSKFSDINKGPALNKAYAALNKWRALDPEQKTAAYRSVSKPKAQRVKVVRIPAYLVPFGPANPLLYYTVRGIGPTQTGAGSGVAGIARDLVDNRLIYDLPATPDPGMINIQAPRGFKPAQVIVKRRIDELDENHKSRFTGRVYSYYPSESVASPLGRSGTETQEEAAFRAIRASTAFETHVAKIGNTITFSPELS